VVVTENVHVAFMLTRDRVKLQRQNRRGNSDFVRVHGPLCPPLATALGIIENCDVMLGLLDVVTQCCKKRLTVDDSTYIVFYYQSIFSERELAICYRPSVRLSVCRL